MRVIITAAVICLIMTVDPYFRALNMIQASPIRQFYGLDSTEHDRAPMRQKKDSVVVDLKALIEMLLADNPQLRSMKFDQQSAESAVRTAGALPDPVLGFNLVNLPVNSFSFDQEPMTGKQITLMQQFPFPGKLGIKEDIARKETAIREDKLQEMQNQLIKQLKSVYYDLFYVDHAIETVGKNKVIIKRLISVAENKYSVGKGLQQDVLRAQLELTNMIDQEISLRQKRLTLAGKLNALINKQADQPVGSIPEPGIQPVSYTLQQLKEQANNHSPLLRAWLAVIGQSDRKVALAQKQVYPDFSLGFAYTQRDRISNGSRGYDFVSAMFSVNLPIFYKRKQNQEVQQMQLARNSAEEGYQNTLNMVYQKLQDAYTGLQKDKQLIDLYKNGAIPQAQQSFKATMSAYQYGEVDFLSLLNSQLSLFHIQLAFYHALSEYNQNIADLESIIGSSLLMQP